MSATGLKEFDRTLQTTNIWLKQLMDELEWDDRSRAYHALRAALHALRNRLPVEEAMHLGAQLPMLVRGFYYEGWHTADKPLKERTLDEFLGHIRDEFRFESEAESGRIAQAVFKLLSAHVTAGEIDDVKHALPASVRELWP